MIACYELTNGLRFETEEAGRICRSFMRMLFGETDPTLTMFAGLRGVRAHTASAVLRFVARRTVGFYKPYEMITRKETALNCNFSVATAQRAFDFLVAQGFLFKMCRLEDGNECYYGLNLKRVHEALVAPIRSLSQALNARMELQELHDGVAGELLEKMTFFAARFANTLIHGVKSFINTAKEAYRTIMSDLLTALKDAKIHATNVSKAKQAKKAQESLFFPNGKPNGKAALAHWYKCCEDYEYVGVFPNMTGKMRGMMGHFITELRDAYELDDESILLTLERAVGKWRHWPRGMFTLQATTKDGKTFRLQFPDKPDFAFFFTYRDKVIPILRDKVTSMRLPGQSILSEL